MSAGERLNQIGTHMEKMDREMPGPNKKFVDFNNSVFKSGSLSTKNKELIAVAISLSTQCEWCISYHTRMALENGATERELLEAGYVAVAMGGGPAAMHMILLEEAIKEFSKKQ